MIILLQRLPVKRMAASYELSGKVLPPCEETNSVRTRYEWTAKTRTGREVGDAADDTIVISPGHGRL